MEALVGLSLIITWPDNSQEEIVLCSLAQFRTGWLPIANHLGLELVPRFEGYFRITSENVEQLIEEVRLFWAERTGRGFGDEETETKFERLVTALEKMKFLGEWDASWDASIG